MTSEQENEENKVVYEVEKLAQLREMQRQNGDTNIVFDNEGHMIVNNRHYQRSMKRAWRATQEEQKSIHFYTKKHNKTTKRTRKLERQNRRKGRK